MQVNTVLKNHTSRTKHISRPHAACMPQVANACYTVSQDNVITICSMRRSFCDSCKMSGSSPYVTWHWCWDLCLWVSSLTILASTHMIKVKLGTHILDGSMQRVGFSFYFWWQVMMGGRDLQLNVGCKPQRRALYSPYPQSYEFVIDAEKNKLAGSSWS